MKLYEAGCAVIMVLIVALLIGYVSQVYLGKDNTLEETAEQIIQINTGLELDLSLDHFRDATEMMIQEEQ